MFKESIGINRCATPSIAAVGVFGSFIILTSIGVIGAISNQSDEQSMTHSDSLVQLHNDLVNWNDSEFDELWNATVKKVDKTTMINTMKSLRSLKK